MALLAALCGSRSEALWFTQEHQHSPPCAESVVDLDTQLIECFMFDFGMIVAKHMRVFDSDSVTVRKEFRDNCGTRCGVWRLD